ncbi:hypothetical protein FYJ24_08535 [Actinomycetaceae bacterium WB03_NA08]|uniref:Uncharacterized protein n=1 Tax=Scrofimicrobium canadense TaxID=2652290 RepID=A0A6N7VSQ3_9ACTO|nr:hypothetical protein [Scrofimicrobium canadense]MSS84809.1 hypothetical protein [Scrofimicrobium canadense]
MVSKSVEPRQPNGMPEVYGVTQAGHHNTNIAHVEHVFMPMVIAPSATLSNTASGAARQLDPSCYHLFVIAGEDFSTDHFLVDPTRALTEATASELKQRYQHLQPDMLQELMNYPALFMAENGAMGRALDDQQAWFGIINSIRVQDNGIRIGFQKIQAIPQQALNDHSHYFAINAYSRISELNRTHWALKRVNLFEAFNDAGINYLPYAITQGGIS